MQKQKLLYNNFIRFTDVRLIYRNQHHCSTIAGTEKCIQRVRRLDCSLSSYSNHLKDSSVLLTRAPKIHFPKAMVNTMDLKRRDGKHFYQ